MCIRDRIHILNRLSCSTLYQIVKSTHHNNSAGPLINHKVYIHIVAALNPLCLRADTLFEHSDKLLICIILIVNCLNLIICRKCSIRFFLKCRILCSEDSDVYKRQAVWILMPSISRP